ncbi:MAG: glutamate synthase subunit beta [Atopobiaceae bacterium]|jgi:glutamate synthase (NADPH/NADH) small chain|nr:glutamate synthase subunit beta [Atopobiaceae bacterium]
MGKSGAYLEIDRHSHDERNVRETLHDYDEFALPLSLEEQREQASRCMMCGVAFCQTGVSFGRARVSGCPLHNLIPEWNDLVWRGLWHDAAARMALTNPFPEFTGRVCPALCEYACNLGLHDEPTTIKDDERAISDVAWESSDPVVAPLQPPAAGAPCVAVVGSGPSGLACAWELARRGAAVTIFEKSDRAGGLLVYGIPNMKLPKDVVARRIAQMQASGMDFKLSCDVCDPSVAKTLEGFDAVVVAAGAGEPRALKVPGADLSGVHFAVDFLTSATKAVLGGKNSEISAAGLDVVVIGGGDTGTDCVATSLRQGAKSVRQFEFLPEPGETREAVGNPWPEYPSVKKTDYGQQEAEALQGADPRSWAVDTLEVRSDGGAVSGLHVVSLDWSDGSPKRIEGSDREIAAQLVLLAMGFSGPRADVYTSLGAKVVEFRGGVRPQLADGTEHRVVASTKKGIAAQVPTFATGDARNGSTLVVTAMADGLACAAEVASELHL